MSVFPSAKDQSIKSLLLIEPFRNLRMASPRLHQNDLAVKAGLFIHLINKLFGKGPEKAALAKLQYPLWGLRQQIAAIALIRQSLIA